MGLGRIGYLKEPIKIRFSNLFCKRKISLFKCFNYRDVVAIMKTHLNMETFRIALGIGKTLGT